MELAGTAWTTGTDGGGSSTQTQECTRAQTRFFFRVGRRREAVKNAHGGPVKPQAHALL